MRQSAQKVGPRILENYNFLRHISRTSSEKNRLKAVRGASRDEVLALVEVCSNILASNFRLTKKQREKIQPYANYARKLARARSELGARKIIQVGGGGFIPALLIPVLAEAARFIISEIQK